MRVTGQDGDVRFEFITGRPALDFLPTLASRGPAEEEKLRTEQDLADWIAESRIVDHAPELAPGRDLERAKEL